MGRLRFLANSLVLALTPSLAFSHEFWIEPKVYQLQSGEEIKADLLVGQEFEGNSYPYRSNQFDRFELWMNGTESPFEGRLGDIPALQTVAEDEGLLVVVHETTDSLLTYTNFEKFQKFADHKDFPNIEDRHVARGLSKERFVESYRRYAKSLIAIGAGAGSDEVVGMKTEIVALDNPYTNGTSELPVRVLLDGSPRKDAQVELFEKAADGTVAISLYTTNEAGEVTLQTKPGHSYLVDAVYLEALANDDTTKGPVWKSHWAALTFHEPG